MESLQNILTELSEIGNNIPSDEQVIQMITDSQKVFVFGAGRSGLAIKMFAMRLAQMGKQIEVVGETTTGPIDQNDLLIVVSCSGETQQTSIITQKASESGATTLLLTANRDSSLGKIVDFTTILGGKGKYSASSTSKQPLGAAFEQLVLLYLDRVVLDLMVEWQCNEKTCRLIIPI